MNEFIAVLIISGLCGTIAVLITWLISGGVNLWITVLVTFVTFHVLFFVALKAVYHSSDEDEK